MLKVKEMNVKDAQLKKALVLLGRFLQNGDDERADKAKRLLKKIHDNEFITAFSGHFSAGKSTMINALVGDRVLPSSPIPTSANLVKVHGGAEDYAKVYYRSEAPLLFEAPYDFETVKDFCKNGDVMEVEIARSDSLLPNGVTVMDTPGVDSTDDAHRVSTESALHLADIVFYVMDYNHVQSELNFMYTKNLLKHGVKLYLIINQIDKHNEAELTFDQFRRSVHDSFASWNVEPSGIYFTSLKEPNHPDNEFEAVKSLIDDALHHHGDWMEATIEAAFNLMETEHKSWLVEQKEMASEPFHDVLIDYSDEELAQLFAVENKLIADEQEMIDRAKNWEKDFESDRDNLLKNAYLMPFETRDLAEKYLASAQSDFKIGFLFSGKKTEEERSARLQAFSASVRKQVEAQLDWHLRQLASSQLAQSGISRDDLQSIAQKLTVTFDDQLLADTVKRGAGVTGESVLNYCEDVAARLKRIAFRETKQYKELRFRSDS